MAKVWAISASPSMGMAFIIGVFLHVFLFNKREWDLHTMKIIRLFFALFVSLAIGLEVLSHFLPFRLSWNPFVFSLGLVGSMVLGLFASITVYRASFHRLNRFPGPFAARLSNLYITRLSAKNLQLYREIQRLHHTYGDVVRVGPSEISIIDAEAVSAIHSNSSACAKGPWYNIEQPAISVHMTRNKDDHSRRRKTWEKAFSTKALRDYEPRVKKNAGLLLQRIEETQGMPFDVSKWFNFYSFDVMGDLAFGENFDMLSSGQEHGFMKLIHKHMVAVGYFSHLIWTFPLFRALPVLNREDMEFQDWLFKKVQHREKSNPNVPDVFSWLLSDFRSLEKPSRQDRLNLQADMQLIAVAGSDTTATTLSCLFFLLATDKPACVKLQEEIDIVFPKPAQLDVSKLSKMTYLQACINETLRLFPPVPSGLQRMTPSEGIFIGERFIPGDTIVTIPSYAQYRDERFFALPDSFIPERWTAKPELIKDISVYVPFGIGKYACVGKQLGLMEVRLVASTILRQFDVDFSQDGAAPSFLSGLRDRFTFSAPSLGVVFTARKRQQDVVGEN